MAKIILDTNFLMIPAQFNVDIFSEIHRICDFKYELYIIDKTIDELNKIIKEQKGKNRANAKVALLLVKHKKIKKMKTAEGKTDDVIISSLSPGDIVATQDAFLQKRAIKKGARVIFLKGTTHLALKQ